jgi:hypothetical protein
VEAFSGWETSGMDSSRPVFVRSDDDGEDEPTKLLRFIVMGADSGEIASAEAMDEKGQVWGHRMEMSKS